MRTAFAAILSILISGFAHAQPTITPGQILVKFRPSAPKPALRASDELAARHGVTAIEPFRIPRSGKPTAPHPFAHLYRLRLSGDPVAASADYAKRPDVLYAQPNHLFVYHADPNDPNYAAQFNLQNTRWQSLQNALGPAKQQVIIAIIDSGVDIAHEDLRDNIWHNPAETNGRPGVDDDGNGYVDDVNGWDFTDAPEIPAIGDFHTRDDDPDDESSHGTHVAGIAAAVTNNGLGITGVAPNAKIMALRAGANLLSGGGFLQEDDLAAAILYAADNGAHIINMSWGGPESAYVIRDALQYASSKGVVLITSAGNSGAPGLSYPAANNNTIAVGAVDRTNRLASFSSTGVALDLVAPGVQILGTRANNAYAALSGTSFSAPHVSGFAAILLSQNPDLTPHQMRSLLVLSTSDLGFPGYDNRFGAGQIDGEKLALRLSDTPPEVHIFTPETNAISETSFEIQARASGESVSGYRLSYGIGWNPTTWTILKSGPQTEDIQHTWPISGIADTIAVLRLEADLTDGAILEDRVQISVRKPPPKIQALVFGPVLDGARLVYQFRWKTDQSALGGVAYRPFGAADFDTLYTGLVHDAHQLTLPHSLPAGPLAFRVVAQNANGRFGFTPEETFAYTPFRVPQNGFTEVGTLPDGALADKPADFNLDGLPEIALMPNVPGQSYSPVQIYERGSNGAFTRVFESREAFLPWSTGDLTGDGREELLGASILRMLVFSGNASNPFPAQPLLDQNGTWGGEIADGDGDGQNEIIARSGTDRGIRIFEGDDAIREVAFLPDPTPGTGDLGTRFVIADFDDDNSPEILAGDGDGDLWIYEYQNGSYRLTFQRPGKGDARWIGGGHDIDGDGDIEFAVARATTDSNDPFNGFWDLEIYSATGANTYAIEWTTRITGAALTGNGITAGDADGDGQPDLVVCLRPDLYVFRADAPNLYRPIWHTPVGNMNRPMIADLDQNGRPEILFNSEDAIRIVERTDPAPTVISPQILRARPLGPSTAEIDWMQTPEAQIYRIHRAIGEQPLAPYTEISSQTTLIDTALIENQPYRYQISAILPNGTELQSGIVSITPNQAPRVVEQLFLAPNRLEIFFNEPMGPETAEPSGYLIANVGHPTSAIIGQNNQRVVLTLSKPHPPDEFSFRILNAADMQGTPINPSRQYIIFINDPAPLQHTLKRADADNSGRIDFPDFLAFARVYETSDPTFDFNEDGIVNFADFITFAGLFGQPVPPDSNPG